MSDAQHLPVSGDFGEPSTDHLGDAAAHATVDFVEDHRRNGAAVARDHLDRETHARQFTAGCDPGKRHRWLAGIGADQELDVVEAAGAFRTLGECVQCDLECSARHSETVHGIADRGGELLRGDLAKPRQLRGILAVRCFRLLCRLFEFVAALFGMREFVEFGAEPRPQVGEVIRVDPMLACNRLHGIQPLFHRILPARIHVDGIAIAPQ